MLAESLLEQAGERLRSAQRILIVSHIRPDGDALGSLLGLGLSLQAAGKQVQMVSEDGVPAAFKHLPGAGLIQSSPKGEFDLVCVVDCSDLERTGKTLPAGRTPDLNLDHHITNLNFAALNLVDAGAVATAEIIARFLQNQGFPLQEDVVSALLTGLITDTIGFRTSNMTPQALRLAADLMERGANLPELYRRALITRSYEASLLWGVGLRQLIRQDRLVWTAISLADRQSIGYPGHDDADLVNMLASVEGADIALILLEQPNGHVKVSWRARPGIDVSQLALRNGGGGHAAASGADIEGDFQSVQADILDQTLALLDRQPQTP
jgi:phosphoesterase RecJ-like protein